MCADATTSLLSSWTLGLRRVNEIERVCMCESPLCAAEMLLDALVKQYAGAYADGFEWPQPTPQSDEEDMDDDDEGSAFSPVKSLIHQV